MRLKTRILRVLMNWADWLSDRLAARYYAQPDHVNDAEPISQAELDEIRY